MVLDQGPDVADLARVQLVFEAEVGVLELTVARIQVSVAGQEVLGLVRLF